MRYAAVLPEPVLALTSTSLPSKARGMHFACQNTCTRGVADRATRAKEQHTRQGDNNDAHPSPRFPLTCTSVGYTKPSFPTALISRRSSSGQGKSDRAGMGVGGGRGREGRGRFRHNLVRRGGGHELQCGRPAHPSHILYLGTTPQTRLESPTAAQLRHREPVGGIHAQCSEHCRCTP
jgi:hypothetical protein